MSAYQKTISRSIRSNFARLLSISMIIFLGIAFVSGLGTLSPSIEASFSEMIKENNVADIIIKSKSTYGFLQNQIDDIKEFDPDNQVQEYSLADMNIEGKYIRIYSLSSNPLVTKLEVEGSLPSNDNEVAVERSSDKLPEYQVGDEISFQGKTYQVVGIVSNPLIYDRLGEPNQINQEPLEQILYFNSSIFPLPVTDLHLRIDEDANIFSNEYIDNVDSYLDKLKQEFPDYEYLTLNDNKSSLLLDGYCDKVSVITFIFPLFFILVVALVVLTTMTRMVEEERPFIGCYKTLGISDGKIVYKYASFSMISCIVSSLIGLSVGLILLPTVVYPAFEGLFFLPKMSSYVEPMSGIISSIIMLVVVSLVTIYVVRKDLKGEPASLLLPKSPSAGKKIFLEKIPFIWRRLSFKYKSCYRNIFRYVKHLLMTVISVAGSTALVFAGFALLDVASKTDFEATFVGIGDTLKPISIVVIAFAILLCIFVIYNLTNMNIGERNREIATLKVLGYHDAETSAYIYREIFIMSVIGVLFGILAGCGLISFIFNYLEFGSLADVMWYSYLLCGTVVLVFIGIVDLLLIPKIYGIDMTSSLKSND